MTEEKTKTGKRRPNHQLIAAAERRAEKAETRAHLLQQAVIGQFALLVVVGATATFLAMTLFQSNLIPE